MVLLVLASGFLGVACKRDAVSSALKYGHLNTGNASSWFISVPPGGTICVNGDHTQQAIDAVKMWANSIGRGSRLNITAGCTSTPNLQVYGKDSPIAKQQCEQWDKVYKLTAAGYGGSGLVYLCAAGSDTLRYNVMIHEVGHSWGLCDQYDAATVNNCDPANSGRKTQSSMMGGASGKTSLTADDIQGMQALAKRTDIGANAQWGPPTGGGGGGPTPPKPTPPTPTPSNGGGGGTKPAPKRLKLAGANDDAWYRRHATDLARSRFHSDAVTPSMVAAIKTDLCQSEPGILSCGPTTLKMHIEVNGQVVITNTARNEVYRYTPPSGSGGSGGSGGGSTVAPPTNGTSYYLGASLGPVKSKKSGSVLGLQVASVKAGSPASRIKLLASDVILRIDGKAMSSLSAYDAAVAASAGGRITAEVAYKPSGSTGYKSSRVAIQLERKLHPTVLAHPEDVEDPEVSAEIAATLAGGASEGLGLLEEPEPEALAPLEGESVVDRAADEALTAADGSPLSEVVEADAEVGEISEIDSLPPLPSGLDASGPPPSP